MISCMPCPHSPQGKFLRNPLERVGDNAASVVAVEERKPLHVLGTEPVVQHIAHILTLEVYMLTCMGACVPLEVECVIESLAAECAKVALYVTVALHVSVQ